ncbi:uncharacterized protein [Drosophila virilis]|uniref:uncharacterized protein n=1 Tax=Drosophila virilis TaxID=7244 RepID=UPI0038B29526
MNDAVSKFVNSCTEITGQSNTVLYIDEVQTIIIEEAEVIIVAEITTTTIITEAVTTITIITITVQEDEAKIEEEAEKNKTANQYTQEVEKLLKALEGAYISEGLSQSLANKYSTTTAVKAMTQNCSIDKVKLIMQAGTFTNMNDAVSKFVNSCTEITGQSNTVLYIDEVQTIIIEEAEVIIVAEITTTTIITEAVTTITIITITVQEDEAKIEEEAEKNKTANQYTQEVEKLLKALEGAYISEGLSQSLANKYSTTTAVKAMTQNCSIDKVKLIMQAGTFTNMNDAVSKFVNSCTEITGQSNTVLYIDEVQTIIIEEAEVIIVAEITTTTIITEAVTTITIITITVQEDEAKIEEEAEVTPTKVIIVTM